jgi:hypothetical protein
MKVKSYNVAPPLGWRYLQAETNHWMSGITFQSLVGKVVQHRNNNGLSNENVAAEVEDQICQRMGFKDQRQYCAGGKRMPSKVGWQQIESFLKTASSFFADGGTPVSQAEAERRAAICATCPLNVGMGGCGVCQQAVNAFRGKILKRTTSQDAKLKSCGICGCDNHTQVHIPIENLRAGTGNLDYSPIPACWKLKGGVNESPE